MRGEQEQLPTSHMQRAGRPTGDKAACTLTHLLTVSATMPEGCTLIAEMSLRCPRSVFMHSQPPPADQTLRVPSAQPESRWVGE